MSRFKAVLARSGTLAEWVCVSMFFAIFALFIVGVVMRYALARPLAWADESILVLFLWTTFLTEALVLGEREQVSFDAVYDLCGVGARRGIGLAGSALVGLMFLAAMPTVFGYITFLWREKTPVMEWRLDIVFSCFMVYWLAVCVRAVAKFVALCGPGWRGQVAVIDSDERANVLG